MFVWFPLPLKSHRERLTSPGECCALGGDHHSCGTELRKHELLVNCSNIYPGNRHYHYFGQQTSLSTAPEGHIISVSQGRSLYKHPWKDNPEWKAVRQDVQRHKRSMEKGLPMTMLFHNNFFKNEYYSHSKKFKLVGWLYSMKKKFKYPVQDSRLVFLFLSCQDPNKKHYTHTHKTCILYVFLCMRNFISLNILYIYIIYYNI